MLFQYDEGFPVFPGSGGGTDIGKASAYGAGGTGGGIVHVTASGPIIVDGEVSSDGGMDAYYSSGNMYRFGAGSGVFANFQFALARRARSLVYYSLRFGKVRKKNIHADN